MPRYTIRDNWLGKNTAEKDLNHKQNKSAGKCCCQKADIILGLKKMSALGLEHSCSILLALSCEKEFVM